MGKSNKCMVAPPEKFVYFGAEQMKFKMYFIEQTMLQQHEPRDTF